MERRPYFVLGDLVVNAAAGGATALLVSWLLPEGWGMAIGMLAGMAVGMLISLPLVFLTMPFFGAMEVMLPVMLTAMLAGMVAGMVPFEDGEIGRPLLAGAEIGLAVVLLTYAANAIIGGEDRRWTS